MTVSPRKRALIFLSQSESLTPRGRRLIDEKLGGPENALEGFSYDIRRLIGDKAYRELAAVRDRGVDALIEAMEKSGVRAVSMEDDDYPEKLRVIPDAPELLYIRGTIPEGPALSVVGSRHNTRYGRDSALRLSRDIAACGVLIVSGLARGIDTAAHEGALSGNGKTAAVLGCGLDLIYPPENKELAEKIVASGGALVSEFALGTPPLPYHFPRRNRIISGLSDALLLIEAALRSGTQSTVNHALDQGRMVFALPGNIDSPGSELPLKLLKEGAEMCTCPSDILSRLRVPERRTEVGEAVSLSDPAPADHPVLRALRLEEKTFEELLAETGMDAGSLSGELSLLELDGKIEKRPGRAYALVRE